MNKIQATFVTTTRLHWHDIGELTLPNGEQVAAMRCRSSADYPETIALNEGIFETAGNSYQIQYVIFEDASHTNQALLTYEQVEEKIHGRDPIEMNDGQRLFIFYWSELIKNAKGTAYEFHMPDNNEPKTKPKRSNNNGPVSISVGPIDHNDEDPCFQLWGPMMVPHHKDPNPKMTTLIGYMRSGYVKRLTIELDRANLYFRVERED